MACAAPDHGIPNAAEPPPLFLTINNIVFLPLKWTGLITPDCPRGVALLCWRSRRSPTRWRMSGDTYATSGGEWLVFTFGQYNSGMGLESFGGIPGQHNTLSID